MAQFAITQEESKEVARATFSNKSDFKAVLVNGDLQPTLLHKIHADNLIAKKQAVLAKDVKIEPLTPTMTTVKVEKE